MKPGTALAHPADYLTWDEYLVGYDKEKFFEWLEDVFEALARLEEK